jgi:hemerythrin superfamily protein
VSESQVDSARDVVVFLKAQHEQIKALFVQVLAASGDGRERAFVQLRRVLAVHETAEEEVVHPRAKTEIDNGATIVDARLQEEHAAKEALAELEKLAVDSAEFDATLRSLQRDVLEHAEAEEQQEFARLEVALDDEQLHRMRNAVKMAEAMAPTRPHAGVESATANLLAGPFASMLDRARDAIRGKG